MRKDESNTSLTYVRKKEGNGKGTNCHNARGKIGAVKG